MLLFDPFAPLHPRTGAFLAPVDVAVGEKEVVLTFDLPGLTQEDLDLHVFDTRLVLRGSRARGELQDGMSFAHVERPSGPFDRTVQLPEGVDPDAITATMHDGVLTLVVPKPERLAPRNIAIEGGEPKQLTGSAA